MALFAGFLAQFMHLFNQFQDGVYGDVQPRFAERFALHRSKDGLSWPFVLPDTFRHVDGLSDRLLQPGALSLHDKGYDRRIPLHLAILEGNLQVVQRMLACRPALLTPDAVLCAIQHQHSHLVQFLLPSLTIRLDRQTLDDMFDMAANLNSLPVLRYLHDFGCIGTDSPMDSAIDHGNLDMLVFLSETRTKNDMPYALQRSAACDSPEIVQYLLDHFDLPELSNRSKIPLLLRVFGREGNIVSIKMVLGRITVVSTAAATAQVFEGAATAGHVHVLDWLEREYSERGSLESWRSAAQGGHVGVMQWLIQRHDRASFESIPGLLTRPLKVFNVEVVQLLDSVGQPLHVVQPMSASVTAYLTQHGQEVAPSYMSVVLDEFGARPSTFTSNTLFLSTEGGHTELIQYLHDHCPHVEFGPAVLDAAAGHGLLAAVQFLHVHREADGCTTAAMDDAASNGHLEVVQFLHEHRTEGCTPYALLGAIERGHLNVVKYLCETVGPARGMTWDVAKIPPTKLAVFEYLVVDATDYFEGSWSNVSKLLQAVEYGRLDLVKQIASRESVPAATVAAVATQAVRLGHVPITKFLWTLAPEPAVLNAICDELVVKAQAYHGPWDRFSTGWVDSLQAPINNSTGPTDGNTVLPSVVETPGVQGSGGWLFPAPTSPATTSIGWSFSSKQP